MALVDEELMDGDRDRRAATPEADKEVGAESGIPDFPGEREGVAALLVGGDVDFLHRIKS